MVCVVRAFLIPIEFATDTLREMADTAAAATLRARKGVAFLADPGAIWAHN